jgi:hypothetical protein
MPAMIIRDHDGRAASGCGRANDRPPATGLFLGY